MKRIINLILSASLITLHAHAAERETQADMLTLKPGVTAGKKGKAGQLRVDSTDDKLKKWNASTSQWSEISGSGSGGSGGKNYFSDNEAEVASKITLYKEGTTQPTSGTTGTATQSTKTIIITTPISGTKSYILTKNAGMSGQGEGFRIQSDVSLDARNNSKSMLISFDYRPYNSYNSQLSVFIYKHGTNRLEPCNGINGLSTQTNVLSGTVGSINTHKCLFSQEDTDTAISLILHNSSTDTALFEMMLDRIHIGELSNLVVPPIQTEWQSYPAVVTGLGTPLSVFAKSRRNGPYLEVVAQIQAGTVATSGNASLSLGFGGQNGNVLIDPSVRGQNTSIGSFGKGSASPTFFYGNMVVQSSNYGAAFFNAQTSTVQAYGSAPVPNTFLGNNEFLDVKLSVPIQGWSTGTNAMSATEIDMRGAYLRSSRTTSIAAATGTTTIVADSKTNAARSEIDTQNIYDTSTGIVTPRVNGRYRVGAYFILNGSKTATFISHVRLIRVSDSATMTEIARTAGYAATSQDLVLSGNSEVQLAANTQYRFEIYRSESVSVYGDTTSNVSYISVSQIPDMTVIANVGREVVSARYGIVTGTATVSIPNGTVTNLDYNLKVHDTHNAVTTGSGWKFKAPVSGYYTTSVAQAWANNTNLTATQLRLVKNGSSTPDSFLLTSTNSSSLHGTFPDIYLNAGDTLDVRVFQTDSGGAARSIYVTASDSATNTYISITKR